MKVGRLYDVLEMIRQDCEDCDLEKNMNDFQAALRQTVNQPTPDNSKVFKESYAKLSSVLSNSILNQSSSIQQKILVEINAIPHIGSDLLDRTTKAIADNNVTPADALSEINSVFQESTKYHNIVKTLLSQFEELNLEFDGLEEGEFEIGVSIPKAITKGNLEGLEEEVHELNQVFRTFKEVSGDEVASPIFRRSVSGKSG